MPLYIFRLRNNLNYVENHPYSVSTKRFQRWRGHNNNNNKKKYRRGTQVLGDMIAPLFFKFKTRVLQRGHPPPTHIFSGKEKIRKNWVINMEAKQNKKVVYIVWSHITFFVRLLVSFAPIRNFRSTKIYETFVPY